MSNDLHFQHISATDDARQHNGNIYNNYHNIHSKPKPPRDNSYEHGLIEAAQKGLQHRVSHLLKFDVRVNFTDAEGRTALHFAAAKEGHETIVRALIDAYCYIGYESEQHGTPLCQAVRNVSMARLLLEQGANVDAKAGRLGSALHIACSLGMLDMIVLLLESGAFVDLFRVHRELDIDTNTLRWYACTPLLLAVIHGHAEVVAALLAAGADANALCAVSRTAFGIGSREWKTLPIQFDSDHLDGTISIVRPASLAESDTISKLLMDAGAEIKRTTKWETPYRETFVTNTPKDQLDDDSTASQTSGNNSKSLTLATSHPYPLSCYGVFKLASGRGFDAATAEQR